MTVNVKVKYYSDWTFSGLSKAQGWEGMYKKAYVGVRELKLGRRFKNVWKILKLSTSSIKFY